MPGTDNSSQPTVAVIGMGYVGLPLAIAFGMADCEVLGLDVDEQKIQDLRAGKSYIKEIPDKEIKQLYDSKKLCPTTDFQQLRQADAVIICVPTPLTEAREPDMQYIIRTSETISKHLQPGQLIILESTTYPGTTEEVVLPILEKSGLVCATNGKPADPKKSFLLAFSPERIDPGNKDFQLHEIPKVVGGLTRVSTEAAADLYRHIFDTVVEVSSAKVAEMTKLLENIYRSVNIALVNELKLICQRMDIDIWEVIDAASTKPYGFQPFHPGPGLGGHCIPIDPFYLTWKARSVDMPTRFIELAGEINTSMPYHVVQTVADALNKRGKSVKGSRILILGLAYKKDVDDVRESPSLKIMELLESREAIIAYSDPHIPKPHSTRQFDFSHLTSEPLTSENLASFDCTLIVTPHSAFDMASIVRNSQLVIDTRNATKGIEDPGGKVVRC